MSVDLTVPPWVEGYVRGWIDRLHLGAWTVRIQLATVVMNDAAIRGQCSVQGDINDATITLRADIEDTDDWRQTILHELCHIAYGRVSGYVEGAVIPQVAEAAQPLASLAYRQHMESYIDAMASTLYWVTRMWDYPEEHGGDVPAGYRLVKVKGKKT